MSLARDARCVMRAGRHAVLSTLSVALPGYPFGSVARYVLDADACPVVLISRLAEHTTNIGVDPRVSLIVLGAGGEVQENARVTWLGRALRIERPETVEPKYLRFFPAARGYRDQLDFEYFRIEPVTLRVVAGFANAHWLSREAYAPPASDLPAGEEELLVQLNATHAGALPALGANALEYAIVGVDCDGFDVRADTEILRFDFGNCVTTVGEAAAAVARTIGSARRP